MRNLRTLKTGEARTSSYMVSKVHTLLGEADLIIVFDTLTHKIYSTRVDFDALPETL